MPIIKCKCCGGDINISEDMSVGICSYCGTTMTMPKVDDDQRAEERQAAIRKEEAERSAKKKKIIAAIIAAAAVVCAATAVVVTQVIIPNNNYNAAVALMDSGDYKAAITEFEKLNGYKDSAAQIEVCQAAFASDEIANLAGTVVGDTITFGSYEQDNDTSNGQENIEWIVLERDGNQILVISKYALDCQQYKTSDPYYCVTWESCSLRNWMNNTFLSSAFTSAEQAYIPTVTVKANQDPEYSYDAGNDTRDQVFLLCITEAEKYFSSDDDRKCVPTAYAIAQGALTHNIHSTDGPVTCWWWLRSPGYVTNAACVYCTGWVDYFGINVKCGDSCVRPAMWINLES